MIVLLDLLHGDVETTPSGRSENLELVESFVGILNQIRSYSSIARKGSEMLNTLIAELRTRAHPDIPDRSGKRKLFTGKVASELDRAIKVLRRDARPRPIDQGAGVQSVQGAAATSPPDPVQPTVSSSSLFPDPTFDPYIWDAGLQAQSDPFTWSSEALDVQELLRAWEDADIDDRSMFGL